MGEDGLPWNRPQKELRPVPPGMNSKPWFKSRLPSKCFAKHKQEQLKFPTALDGRRWVFVKEGLDDFRRGCPPCKNIITRSVKEGFLPTISHGASHLDPKVKRKQPKDACLFSKLSLAQQKRKAFVENIEASLTQHPLALWPLEENLPPHLLLNVLEVLDPDRKMKDKWAYCEGRREVTKQPTKDEKDSETKVCQDPPKFPGAQKHGEFHRNKPKPQESAESVYHKHIPKGVYDFCEWTKTFGDPGIDEEFLMKQFDVSYQCKPTYGDSATKKISLLPSDLKYSRKLSKVKEIRFSIQESNFERKLRKPNDPYKCTKDKIRYGAWYLKPKLWKKLVNNEPLIDPKELLEYEEAFRKPDIIEDLYGTIAFKDYIVSKGYPMPNILEKLFMKKGWNYDAVNTPLPRILKTHELIMQEKDEDYDDEND